MDALPQSSTGTRPRPYPSPRQRSGTTQHVRLHGIGLEVRTDDAEQRGGVAEALRLLGFAHTTPPLEPDRLRLQVMRTAEPAGVPPGAVRIACEGDEQLYRVPDGFLLDTPALQIRFQPERRSAQLTVRERQDLEFRNAALFSGLLCAVLALLRYRRRYGLHAACLVLPGGSGCLLPAPSGSGKSTLAAGLAHRGWGYLSDDLVLLSEAEDGIRAQALLRHFSLLPDTAALFPHAERHRRAHRFGGPKWNVDIRSLFPAQQADACRPRLILFPEITGHPESTLTPLGASEALLRLLAQVNVSMEMEPEIVARQMALCRRLVAQCRSFRLSSGTDLKHEPGRLAELLRTAGVLPSPLNPSRAS